MIIKYSVDDDRIIERDLSKEKITGWVVTDLLGYKPKGSLVIDFDTSHIKKPTNEGGIYPPVENILNYNEVLNYLKSNFGHLHDKAWKTVSYTTYKNGKRTIKPVLRSQPRELNG